MLHSVTGLELAAISLGTAVTKSACGIWLGDHKLASGTTQAVIDLAAGRLRTAREQRGFRRLWEQAAEVIADRIEPMVEREFRDLPEHERIAALDAVGNTFAQAGLREADLFARDLDAAYLDRYLRAAVPDAAGRAGLSDAATHLYDLLLRECCAYTIEAARMLPQAGIAALTEVLRRETQVLDGLRTVLDRLPTRRGVIDFERDYRQLVGNQLDRIEFFGATLSETSRRYPLSIAYLSLSASADFPLRRRYPEHDRRGQATSGGNFRVEEILASTRRLFIRGHAGLGKTTLLQWIAVTSARKAFPPELREWNGTIPFFIPLRRYSSDPLPAPEEFLREVGRHIAIEMPPGWVQQRLRFGDAIVLVDGVDELSEERRTDAQRWLRELVDAFPYARFVVTSRPAAVPADWLGDTEFDVAELEPMTRSDVSVFVHRWHEAMREGCATAEERAELTDYERGLLDSLGQNRHLRVLAGYPLLCALLCALHRDRRSQLPANRMELYEIALHMLLERRDRERRIDDAGTALSRTDKTLLLQDIAYWLLRNKWSTAPANRVTERIAAKLRGMAQIRTGADEVYVILLERSGLLREPVEGQTDFVHRSFQEYLAAKEAIESDDIGVLVDNAYTDLWSDVIVLAAGHAPAPKRTELLGQIVERAAQTRTVAIRDALRLVAVASLESSPELDPELRARIQEAVASLLPPRTMNAARSLARAGSFTLDLLARSRPSTATEVAATIRAVGEIGDPAALPLLARFGKDSRKAVVKELLSAWPKFDPEEYARIVLPHYPLDDRWFDVEGPRLVPGLKHLDQLRWLWCAWTNPELVPLRFVADVPRLTALGVPNYADLSPVADLPLEIFWIKSSAPNSLPVSVAPLAAITPLSDVSSVGPIADASALRRLANLSTLALYSVPAAAQLDDLASLSHLTDVLIGSTEDLTTLEPLAFLTAPRSVGLWNCPRLSDLSAVRRWSATLDELRLIGSPIADLGPLADLPALTSINLASCGPLDLAPVGRAPALARLVLGAEDGIPLPDFAPLRTSRTLREIRIDAQTIDVSALGGMRDVTIFVPRKATVTGAGGLGRGSRVRRLQD
jgi:hypothetical protein